MSAISGSSRPDLGARLGDHGKPRGLIVEADPSDLLERAEGSDQLVEGAYILQLGLEPHAGQQQQFRVLPIRGFACCGGALDVEWGLTVGQVDDLEIGRSTIRSTLRVETRLDFSAADEVS